MAYKIEDGLMIKRLVLLAGLGMTAPLVAAETQSIGISGGALVDAGRELLYVADPRGYTQAIVLDDGRASWVSAERAYPIAFAHDRLLALGAVDQFGLGMLLLIDPGTGIAVDRIAFDLPEGVSASPVAQPQRKFSVSTLETAAGVRIFWTYSSRPLRGALIVDENGSTGGETQEGVIDFVIGSGRNHAIPVLEAVTAPTALTPDLRADEKLPGVTGDQFRSADADHVLASNPIDGSASDGYRWTIHAQRDAEALGQLESPYAQAPFVVRGSKLIYRAQAYGALVSGNWVETPTRLVAFDLENARELWSVPIMDHEYRGPLPP